MKLAWIVLPWILGALGCLAETGQIEKPLDPDVKRKLSENGFVITNTRLKQGFSAYIGTRYPAFITSDSVLMAYTAVLERMISEQRLKPILASE